MESTWKKYQHGVFTSKETSKHSLVFICRLPIKTGIRFSGDLEPVKVKLPAQCTVHQLRLQICMIVQETNRLQDPLALLDPEKYSLLYTKGEDQYELYDDYQVLQTLDAPWFQDKEGQTVWITVMQRQDNPQKRQSYQLILDELIGYDLDFAAGSRLSELSFTRRKFATPRKEELKKRDPIAYATEPWTTSAPIANDQDHVKRKLVVTLHYENLVFNIYAELHVTPSAFLKAVWESLSLTDQCFKTWSENYILKICGREEFLCGDFQLSEFLWARHCLKNMIKLNLMMVPLASLPDDTVRQEYWPQVDSLTGLSSSHEEISIEGKETEEIVMISLWDCKRNLKVKLIGFDMPELPIKCPQHVYVEVAIIYGSKVVSSICTSSKDFADEVLWNTWLEFDIPLKDIPSGAKLGFTINSSSMETSPTKDLKSPPVANKESEFLKDKGKVLYFANFQLIDHRSLLSQGSHTLHMWPYVEQEEEGFTYEADKLSTATNPDVAKSMAITFLLERYSFPVVLPQNKMSSHSTTPSSPVQMPESSPSFVSERNSLKRFREESVRYASNLPQFLRKVDWLKPCSVQDVHWLLGHWEPEDLELHVALELLSVKYTDQKVRRLAVQRLELMSNEEVLRYLLQLVQVRKYK